MAPRIHHPAFHQKKAPQVATFFREHCAQYFRHAMPARGTAPYRVAFDISGAAGGRFTLDLSRGLVEPQLSATADAKLEVPAADFVHLLEGKLDVPRAVAEGRLVYTGQLGALTSLVALFDLEAAS